MLQAGPLGGIVELAPDLLAVSWETPCTWKMSNPEGWCSARAGLLEYSLPTTFQEFSASPTHQGFPLFLQTKWAPENRVPLFS